MNVLEMDRATIADALDVMAHGRRTYARSREVRDYAAGRIRYDLHAREVYSYGDHFPLLRFVPRGRRRRPLIVLNGDVWRNGGGPSRTADHQAIARELAAELGDTCVIPFSALTGAGVDIDSIRPIHTRTDETWRETVSAPAHRAPQWVTRETVKVDRTAHTIRGVPPKERNGWRPMGGYGRIVRADDGMYHWSESVERAVAPDADGLYHWSEHRHRLGDCLFSAVREETYLRPAKPFEESHATARARFEVAWRESYCNAAPAATDSRTDLHEVGPSGACIHCGRQLQTRVTVRRRGLYLSSFDYNEAPPLYFLAEVPRGSGADTVETAIEALAPRAVHAARARSIPVERQGDVFFIRTALDDAELESRGIVSRARLTLWTRVAKPRRGEPGYVAESPADRRRRLERMRKARRAEYRRLHAEMFAESLARYQAPRDYRRYRSSPSMRQTIRDRAAMAAAAIRVYNNADGGYLTDGNRARAAYQRATLAAYEKFAPPHEWRKRAEKVRRALAIYGTAHTAREVIRTRSGAVYVRGTVRHLPELEPGRTGAPDHRRLELDPDCWYLAVRNTVPRQTRRRTL